VPWKSGDLIVRQVFGFLQSFSVLALQEEDVRPRVGGIEPLLVGHRGGLQCFECFLGHAKIAFLKQRQFRFDFPRREGCRVQCYRAIDSLVGFSEVS
jgi:hypothetical protein